MTKKTLRYWSEILTKKQGAQEGSEWLQELKKTTVCAKQAKQDISDTGWLV